MVEHRYADFNILNVATFKVKYKDFFRMQSLYFFTKGKAPGQGQSFISGGDAKRFLQQINIIGMTLM